MGLRIRKKRKEGTSEEMENRCRACMRKDRKDGRWYEGTSEWLETMGRVGKRKDGVHFRKNRGKQL
jgi:hypothetical protein